MMDVSKELKREIEELFKLLGELEGTDEESNRELKNFMELLSGEQNG